MAAVPVPNTSRSVPSLALLSKSLIVSFRSLTSNSSNSRANSRTERLVTPGNMAVRVVEFSSGGYKIRKIFA